MAVDRAKEFVRGLTAINPVNEKGPFDWSKSAPGRAEPRYGTRIVVHLEGRNFVVNAVDGSILNYSYGNLFEADQEAASDASRALSEDRARQYAIDYLQAAGIRAPVEVSGVERSSGRYRFLLRPLISGFKVIDDQYEIEVGHVTGQLQRLDAMHMSVTDAPPLPPKSMKLNMNASQAIDIAAQAHDSVWNASASRIVSGPELAIYVPTKRPVNFLRPQDLIDKQEGRGRLVWHVILQGSNDRQRVSTECFIDANEARLLEVREDVLVAAGGSRIGVKVFRLDLEEGPIQVLHQGKALTSAKAAIHRVPNPGSASVDQLFEGHPSKAVLSRSGPTGIVELLPGWAHDGYEPRENRVVRRVGTSGLLVSESQAAVLERLSSHHPVPSLFSVATN